MSLSGAIPHYLKVEICRLMRNFPCPSHKNAFRRGICQNSTWIKPTGDWRIVEANSDESWSFSSMSSWQLFTECFQVFCWGHTDSFDLALLVKTVNIFVSFADPLLYIVYIVETPKHLIRIWRLQNCLHELWGVSGEIMMHKGNFLFSQYYLLSKYIYIYRLDRR